MKKLIDLALDFSDPVTRDFPADALFAAASSALLLVERDSGRIARANAAAAQLLGMPDAALPGSNWLAAFHPDSTRRLADACLDRGRQSKPLEFAVRDRDGRATLRAMITSFNIGRDAYLLVRLLPEAAPASMATSEATARVLGELDRTPTGFVVTNELLQVDYANRAFLEMVRAASGEEVRNRSLARWLALTDDDLQRLRLQATQRQATVVIITTLQAGPGAARMVELTAIAVPDGPRPCWGFTLRVLEHGGRFV